MASPDKTPQEARPGFCPCGHVLPMCHRVNAATWCPPTERVAELEAVVVRLQQAADRVSYETECLRMATVGNVFTIQERLWAANAELKKVLSALVVSPDKPPEPAGCGALGELTDGLEVACQLAAGHMGRHGYFTGRSGWVAFGRAVGGEQE